MGFGMRRIGFLQRECQKGNPSGKRKNPCRKKLKAVNFFPVANDNYSISQSLYLLNSGLG